MMKERIYEEKTRNDYKVVTNEDLQNKMARSLIGFTWYPISGIILQEVIRELGLSEVKVMKISCWKFMLQFPDLDSIKYFNKEKSEILAP